MIDCTERLFEMGRAIFADRQQANCETDRPFTTHAVEALTQAWVTAAVILSPVRRANS